MNTIVIVKDAMLQFIEVPGQEIDYSILEYESNQHIKSVQLGNGIVAIISNHSKNQPVYLLKLANCFEKITGNFMLINGTVDQFSPLTEEQEDFIIEHCEVIQESSFDSTG